MAKQSHRSGLNRRPLNSPPPAVERNDASHQDIASDLESRNTPDSAADDDRSVREVSPTKPADTPHSVFVEVARELLPQLREWSRPMQLQVSGEEGDRIQLVLRDIEAAAPLRNEHESLLAFAGWILDEAKVASEGAGDVEVSEIQEAALDCGLVHEVEVTEACSGDCACTEFGFPSTCQRFTALGQEAFRVLRRRQDAAAAAIRAGVPR